MLCWKHIKWTNNEASSHTGIYSTLCKDCNKHYINETQRNLEKRIWTQMINQNKWLKLFSSTLELKYTFNFSQATLIKPIHCKKSQRLLESAVISETNHIKQCSGFYQILPYLANIILKKKKKKKKKIIFFTLWHHTFLFLIILLLIPSSPQLQPILYNIDNFLRHHISRYLSIKRDMPKPWYYSDGHTKTPFTQTLPYFFLSAP